MKKLADYTIFLSKQASLQTFVNRYLNAIHVNLSKIHAFLTVCPLIKSDFALSYSIFIHIYHYDKTC